MDVMTRRQRLNLTQAEAAERAGVTVATWRRFEADPASVLNEVRSACERVLEHDPIAGAVVEEAKQIRTAWQKSEDLTPRQAFALTMVLDRWTDELASWHPTAQRLGDVGPFPSFDERVMFRIGENRAYAAAIARRCTAIADMIRTGTLPFHHDGPMIDETLIAAAAKDAAELYPDLLAELPQVFDLIGIRTPVEDDELDAYMPGDQDWDEVDDRFDELSRWPFYDYPLGYGEDTRLSSFLDTHHPFTWFDAPPLGGVGAGEAENRN